MSRRSYPRALSILLWCVFFFSVFTASGSYGLLLAAQLIASLQ